MKRAASAVKLGGCLAVAVATWGCGEAQPEDGAEAVGAAESAIQTCFTVQRGVFGAVDDAEIRSDLPNSASGSGVVTRVGIDATSSARSSLYRFDVSNIPAGVTIDSALVTLTQAGAGSNALLGAYQITSPWAENGATFNNITFAASPLLTFSNGGGGYVGPISFDISALVQQWVDGTSSNEGVMLRRWFPLYNSTFTFERTSEDANVSNRPSLAVCYTCTPTTEICDGIDNNCDGVIDEGGVCNTCGNGTIEAGETCDDGSTVNGDGCSSTCQLEPGWEVEQNGTAGTANDFAAVSLNDVVYGRIFPAYDVDKYSITVPFGFTATLDADILDGPLAATCTNGQIASDLYLSEVQSIEFGVPSTGTCSHLHRTGLYAGTYTLSYADSFLSNPPKTFDYTLAVNLTLHPCGDGIRGEGEQCDDGNTTNGDGCNDLCTLEAYPETEPNGTSAEALANGVRPISVSYAANISPLGDVDVFAFDVTTVSDVKVETFGPYGAYTYCPVQGIWDTYLELLAPDAQTLLAANDNDGVNIVGTGAQCSRIDPATSYLARKLQPGTYYARVMGRNQFFTINDYRLVIRYVSQCGDGVVEGSEECDGGAGCDLVNCLRIPVCGDGIIDGPENCDDGNTVGGDGCDSSCAAEGPGVFSEVEPNASAIQADLRATTGSKIRITHTTKISGSIVGGDKDFYRVDLGSNSVLHAETLDAGGVDCASPVATQMKLYDATGVNVLATNTTSGIGSCSLLLTWLPKGRYYLDVERISSTGFGYLLDVKIGADFGSEAEVNDTAAQANTFLGSDGFVLGHHLVNTDEDWYAVTVPGGSSIRAETLEGGGEPCSTYGQIDTRITLYDAGLSQLADDDNAGGSASCSRIDGFGALPANAGASGLAAGTYYLQVRAAAGAQSGGAGQFDYRLYVSVH